jgi:putative FmdB family regulatory protein
MRHAIESKEKKDMPVYSYRCDSCGIQFERQQSFHDAPLKTCPECRKKTVKRIITPTKVIFKGSGFYATDHKSASGESSHKSKKEHSHDHDHDHSVHSHASDESKPAEKKKSKSETSE